MEVAAWRISWTGPAQSCHARDAELNTAVILDQRSNGSAMIMDHSEIRKSHSSHVYVSFILIYSLMYPGLYVMENAGKPSAHATWNIGSEAQIPDIPCFSIDVYPTICPIWKTFINILQGLHLFWSQPSPPRGFSSASCRCILILGSQLTNPAFSAKTLLRVITCSKKNYPCHPPGHPTSNILRHVICS